MSDFPASISIGTEQRTLQLPTLVEDLANVMISILHQKGASLNGAPALGTVFWDVDVRSCTRVHWVLLSLPVSVLLFMVIFLAATVFQKKCTEVA